MSEIQSFGSAVAGCNFLAETRRQAGSFCKRMTGIANGTAVGSLNSVKVLPIDGSHGVEAEKQKKAEKAMFWANQSRRR